MKQIEFLFCMTLLEYAIPKVWYFALYLSHSLASTDYFHIY